MAQVVPAWVHVIGLLICATIFAVSLQQLCITSIFGERPKSIYRILTVTMTLVELLLHSTASLWFESPSDILTLLIHIFRLLSAVLISLTFYPILMTTVGHFYASDQFDYALKVPKWLIHPWKFLIAGTATTCIICYIIAFTLNSLFPLYIYYIVADIVAICGCITVLAAMVDVYYKVHETATVLDTAIQTNKRMEQNKVIGHSLEIERLSTQDSISRGATIELEQAKSRINQGKVYIIVCCVVVTFVFLRAVYILYDNLQSKQYYQDSTMHTNPFSNLLGYLGSVFFVLFYDGGLVIWLWKSTKKMDDAEDTMAFILCRNCACCCNQDTPSLLQRASSNKDKDGNEQNNDAAQQDNEEQQLDGDDEQQDQIHRTETDELGLTVGDDDDHEEIEAREETEMQPTNHLMPAHALNEPRLLNKNASITVYAAGSAGHLHPPSMTGLEDLSLLYKCKVVVYIFDAVFTKHNAAIIIRKSPSQIENMDEAKFYKPFGGKERADMLQRHIAKMAGSAILYCVSTKIIKPETLQAIMQRIGVLQCFSGPVDQDLLQQLNQVNPSRIRSASDLNQIGNDVEQMEKRISNSQSASASPNPPTQTSSPRGPKVFVPSRLATLDEDDEHEHGNQMKVDTAADMVVVDMLNAPHTPTTPVNNEEDEMKAAKSTDTVSSNRATSSEGNKPYSIYKYEGDNVSDEIRGFYENRLFAKNHELVKQCNGRVNEILFKFWDYYDVINDELLVVTPDKESVLHWKAIGLCKGYHVKAQQELDDQEKITGLTDKDMAEIESKYI